MKKFIFCVVILISTGIYAAQVPVEKAEKIAKIFLNVISEHRFAQQKQQIHYARKFCGTDTISDMFLFNFSDGFILIAAEDKAIPVLGYSVNTKIDPNDLPDAFLELVHQYSLEIEFIRSNQLKASREIEMQWNGEIPISSFTDNISSVSPLLNTNWHQGCYYNASCPSDPAGPCNHVWAGCVATAMGQVMKYYQFPTSGNGSHSYFDSNYGYQYANFGSASYNYNAMPNSISSGNSSIANFLYQIAVSVDMQFDPSGSGAFSSDARDAMVNYFDYSSAASLEHRNDYSTSDWVNMIMDELDNDRPVLYYGYGTGGHAFVCDGYQGSNYFHFNWGWGGSADGYFYLSNLNPSGYTFTNNQEAIISLYPNQPQGFCSGLTVLSNSSGSFSDGSGTSNYGNESDCSWLIDVSGAGSITLNFSSFSLEEDYDFLRIYDGDDDNAPLLASYTGYNLPQSVTGSGDEMYIVFSSDQSVTDEGFSCSYNSSSGTFCNGLTTLNGSSGSFSDGSGSSNYGNNSNCSWLISVQNACSINLNFNNVHLEEDYDFIYVYDGPSSVYPLLASITGILNTVPPIHSTGSILYIEFVTDVSITDEGFEAYYSTTIVNSPVILAQGPITFCEGQSVDLCVYGNYDYFQWQRNGVNLSGQTSNCIQVFQSGNYTVKVLSMYCEMQSQPVVVQVNPIPTVTLNVQPASICIQSSAVQLSGGYPAGGIYWGTGISGSYFNPALSGPGYYTIGYTYTLNGCTNSVTDQIFVDQCAGIETFEEITLNCFPNPAKEIVYLEATAQFSPKLEIYLVDQIGRVLLLNHKLVDDRTIELHLGSLTSGIYTLRVVDSEKPVSSAILIIQ